MSLFGNRLKYVNCRVWDSPSQGSRFPELEPDVGGEVLSARTNTGVCLSGGGTRSASCSIGQLRALHALGLLAKVRYISAVSGGSWAAVPYTFLPGGRNDGDFLGQGISPAALTVGDVSNLDKRSFVHAISDSFIVDNFFKQAARFAGDETFSRAVGDIFLERFGLDSLERLFSLNDQSVAGAVAREKNVQPTDFYTVREGRPYLIVGGTILRREHEDPRPKLIQVEMTPLYTGMYSHHLGVGSGRRDIGGGMLSRSASTPKSHQTGQAPTADSESASVRAVTDSPSPT